MKQNQKLGPYSVMKQSTTVLSFQNRASKVQHPASRFQCPEPSFQCPVSRVQSPVPRVQCSKCSIQSAESSVQDPESRVQRPGSSILSQASGAQHPEFYLMMICGWNPLMSQNQPENDHKRQCICQIRHQKMRVVHPVFQICLFYTSQTRDSTLDPIKLHYFTKQGSTRFSFFVMICAYRQNFVIKTTFKYRADHSHFLMPYLADALPFMVIFWSML